MGATTGDAQSGLDALLAFVFMSPDREEKTQMLLDRCGLDALFKVHGGLLRGRTRDWLWRC